MHMIDLSGRRILVVEDEMLLAMDLEDALTSHGAEVLGPVSSITQALALLADQRPDAATLDMNLGGKSSLPVADDLVERKIPFVVVSGYSETYASQPSLRGVAFVKKPYDSALLFRAIGAVLQ